MHYRGICTDPFTHWSFTSTDTSEREVNVVLVLEETPEGESNLKILILHIVETRQKEI